MHNLLKTAAAALLLASGMAMTANAQQVGPAAGGPGPSVATLPAPPDIGPRASSHNSIPAPQNPVTPSAAYVGPAPGASDAKTVPHYEPSGTWSSDPWMHPYQSGTVRPN
jgi:hypothetical protein